MPSTCHGSAGSHPHRWLRRALIAAAGTTCVCGAVSAQGLPSAPKPASSEFSGRDFAGLRFPMRATTGELAFSAARVSSWSQESNATGGSVQQLFLSGDVRVKLGLYEFTAVKAVVWLEKIADTDANEEDWEWLRKPDLKPPEIAKPTSDSGVYQVFVYFDRVASPVSDVRVSVQANRLPVRAVIRIDRPISMTFDTLSQGRPSDPLIAEGEAQLAAALRKQEGLDAVGPADRDFPQRGPSVPVPSESRSYLPPTASQMQARAAREIGPGGDDESMTFSGPIFAKDGIFTVSPGDVTLVSGETENSLLLSNGLVIQYSDTRAGRSLQLTAQRGVIFMEPRKIEDLARLRPADIRGIYLEGDVIASDGRYTLRGPRVYYDVQKNKAVVLDAVFWTYDSLRRLPLYVRAESIRQRSSNEFVAEKARLATSSFFEPDFSVGASTVTITRRPAENPPEGLIPTVSSWARGSGGSGSGAGGGAGTGLADAGGYGRGYELDTDYPNQSGGGGGGPPGTENYLDAKRITLNAEGVPFFFWPSYEGTIDEPMLRDLRAESRSGSGFAIKTRWNAYNLLGLRGTAFTRADLLLDAYFSRGPGLGTRLEWAGPDTQGNAFLYGLFDDRGTDVLKTGARVKNRGDNRGLILTEHRVDFDDNWSFFGELAYQSDATFVESFYPEMAELRREFTTQAYVRRVEDNTMFAARLKGSLNDFSTNEYQLLSQGYSVTKAPELQYIRQADPLLSDWFGDVLTWTHEYRFSRMATKLDRARLDERGIADQVNSLRLFGLLPNQTIYDDLRSQGYLPQDVYRFDAREEVNAKLELGPVNVVPFMVGRFTGYDHKFETFSRNTEDDRYRFWGSTGLTANTQIQRVDDSVESRLLDLHRMRHIIEPNATLYTSTTNRKRGTIPIYDEDVEGISKGTVGRLGVNQIWQTQRGRPGRYYNVDVFTLDVNYVNSSRDSELKSPVGRFLDFRPELSSFGEYGTADASWRVTDATTLTGGSVYDIDRKEQARTSAGVIVQQSPDLVTAFDYRHLNALDLTTVGANTSYRLASQYILGLSGSYDTTRGEFQSLGGSVSREFQSLRLGFNIAHSIISNETRFGFTLTPKLEQSRGRLPLLGEQGPPQ
ncbi:MAG TPA: LPS assembly protein LptD [Phycisphaerales bacterium]